MLKPTTSDPAPTRLRICSDQTKFVPLPTLKSVQAHSCELLKSKVTCQKVTCSSATPEER